MARFGGNSTDVSSTLTPLQLDHCPLFQILATKPSPDSVSSFDSVGLDGTAVHHPSFTHDSEVFTCQAESLRQHCALRTPSIQVKLLMLPKLLVLFPQRNAILSGHARSSFVVDIIVPHSLTPGLFFLVSAPVKDQMALIIIRLTFLYRIESTANLFLAFDSVLSRRRSIRPVGAMQACDSATVCIHTFT